MSHDVHNTHPYYRTTADAYTSATFAATPHCVQHIIQRVRKLHFFLQNCSLIGFSAAQQAWVYRPTAVSGCCLQLAAASITNTLSPVASSAELCTDPVPSHPSGSAVTGRTADNPTTDPSLHCLRYLLLLLFLSPLLLALL